MKVHKLITFGGIVENMATYETGESVVGRLVCRGVQVVDVDSLSGTNSGRVHTLKVTAICDDKIQHCYVYQCQHRINAYILMDDFSTGIVKRTSSDVKLLVIYCILI